MTDQTIIVQFTNVFPHKGGLPVDFDLEFGCFVITPTKAQAHPFNSDSDVARVREMNPGAIELVTHVDLRRSTVEGSGVEELKCLYPAHCQSLSNYLRTAI